MIQLPSIYNRGPQISRTLIGPSMGEEGDIGPTWTIREYNQFEILRGVSRMISKGK